MESLKEITEYGKKKKKKNCQVQNISNKHSSVSYEQLTGRKKEKIGNFFSRKRSLKLRN